MKLTGLSLGAQGLSDPSGIPQSETPQSQHGLSREEKMGGRGTGRREREEKLVPWEERREERW